MRLNLTTKTFLTLVITTLLILALSALAVRWSFQRGLMDYVNELRSGRIELLMERLEDIYVADGSFERLRNNRRLMHRLMTPRGNPDRPARRRDGELPVGPGREIGPRDGFDPLSTAQGITLYDTRGDLIAGPPNTAGERVPVIVDGQQVGELVVAPLRALTSATDRGFSQRQGRWLALIFGASLCIAALVAWWFARQLTLPIKQLAGGARALTQGDYGTSIDLRLGDELGQLTADFNTLSQTLASNRDQRQRMMADISHELRTPLAALRGQISALRDGVREASPQNLDVLDSQVTRLVRLVDDIYELSLADSGALRFDLQPVDIAALLRQVARSFSARYEENRITLDTELQDDLPQVVGDAQRLEQLFANLLENSVRYTDAEGQVTLAARVEGGQVIVSLDDSAPGVAEDELPHLFERLYRVEKSRNRASGGAGLGLALVEQIALAHDAALRAEPSPLGGLRIVLTLKAHRED